MRRILITALAVLAISTAICLISAWAVSGATQRAEDLRQSAEHAAKLGDTEGAMKYTRAMKEAWQRESRWLELIISHDDLSDVQSGIADAQACLENGDRDDFLRASAAVAAVLERLRTAESLRLTNLF